MQYSSATVRTAKWLLAYADLGMLTFEDTDVHAAEAIGISKRAYRDALRHLDRIGAVTYEHIQPGPVRKDAGAHRRTVLINVHSPYWAWLAAAEDIAALAW